MHISNFVALLGAILPLGRPVLGIPAQEYSSNHIHRRSSEVDVTDNALEAKRRATTYTTVPNGEDWYDSNDVKIGAWGGNVLKDGSTYYWVGQSSPSLSNATAGALVNLYKSTDLLNWVKVGSPITVWTKDTHGNQLMTYARLERPKLLKSASTGRYVIWSHWEMANSYAASQVVVATADAIGGPYTITPKGHHRPGAGNTASTAMGDRLGGLRYDFSTASRTSGDTSHPYMPNVVPYPPMVTQYGSPTTVSPYYPTYVSASTYGTVAFTNVRYNVTLKAIAVEMTAWNATLYNKYVDQYNVSPATYIVQYPTNNRSVVTTAEYIIGQSPTSSLAEPVIGPTLSESTSTRVVYVNSGDAAFITVQNQDTLIYYTTDGSNPTTSSTQYVPGTRITISGSAGTTLTIKALAARGSSVTSVVTQVYEIASDPSDVPIFAPIINYSSGTYSLSDEVFASGGLRIYSPSYRTTLYYTMDGLDPNPPLLGSNLGYGSRDMTVWTDPASGTSYLITATDNIYGRVWQLTHDLTDVVPAKEYDVFVDQSREAPALVRHGGASGKYVYLVTSAQSGWYPNQAQYKRATDMSAGFSLGRDSVTGYRDGTSTWSALAPLGDASTFGSQPTWILNVGTDAKPAYIYIGDRYNATDTSRSSYIWTPLYINDATAGENGINGSGNMTLVFNPRPSIQVAKRAIKTPSWSLLSLNKPVAATSSTPLTSAQIAAGTYNFSSAVANDGIDYDVNVYDTIKQYYIPSTVPYYWQVDLGRSAILSWVGLSFYSVSGSDAVDRYYIFGSHDNKSWTQLVDNTGNILPGYKSHLLSGRYRYVRLNVTSIYDVVHSTSASWEAGLYEMSVYGK